MYWCCDCKNKYIKERCNNCSKMNNYQEGNAVIELLNEIEKQIRRMPNANPSYYNTVDVVDRYDVLEFLEDKIKELKDD